LKQQIVGSLSDLDRLESAVIASAEATIGMLKELLNSTSAFNALALLKFGEIDRDPLDSTRPLNIVEQLNQSFTYLASIGAARWLLAQHPECLPLVLNLGTAPGADVESKCGRFVAETFAATHPDSNDKLRRDVAKVAALTGEHKFVFFLSPVDTRRTAPTGVTVIRLDHPILGVLASALGDVDRALP